MGIATRYLEQEKVSDLEAQLRAQGYEVWSDYRSESGQIYDLVATKGDRRIVYEVKALSSLAGHSGEIRELRNRAFREGYTDFRLVVVSPPRQVEVSVPGLDAELVRYMGEHVPENLQSLASNVRVEAVSNLEIGSITVGTEDIEVSGEGVVEVVREYGNARDGVDSPDDYPFRFHVLLDRDLKIKDIYGLDVDVSEFSE
jgi:dihydroorotase-like cyclic amidohydrolase